MDTYCRIREFARVGGLTDCIYSRADIRLSPNPPVQILNFYAVVVAD